MKVTAFVDVLSHWCLAAMPALDALRATLADDVALEVVIAPLGDGGPVGFTNAAEAWLYTRGTFAYGTVLDPSARIRRLRRGMRTAPSPRPLRSGRIRLR